MKFPLTLVLAIAGFSWHATAHALACGDTITEDTTLTGDLSCTNGAYALYVATSGVTIDFDGYTVSGTETMDGIRVANASDVSLLYGNLTGFRAGVNASRADNLTVNGMLLYGLGSAVIVNDSRSVTLVRNAAYAIERWGFFLGSHRGGRRYLGAHTIVGNRLDGPSTLIGICGYANSRNVVRGNELFGGSLYLLDGTGGNEVTGNILESRDTSDSGILLLGSRDNLVMDNLVFLYNKGISLIPAYTGTCPSGSLLLPQVSDNRILSNDIIIGQIAVLLGVGNRRLPLVFCNRIHGNTIAAFDLGLHLRTDTFGNSAKDNDFFNTLLAVRNEGFLNQVPGTTSAVAAGPSRISVKPSTRVRASVASPSSIANSAAEARAHAARARPQGMERSPLRPTLQPRVRLRIRS
ncbi:MAG TPA: NosD domain-containing protein [Pseudoxanthomonas sp.]